jgi:alpha-1,3-rhamnosyltransferase
MTGEEPKIEDGPLVSILMPCYNHEAYVVSSLESVAASDYKLIEFIFIDDASKDNSFNIAKKWFEGNQGRFARTVCIQHDKNRGICATLNELCAFSHGEYISIIASDDLLLMDAISKQVSFCQSHGVDFVFSDCLLIDESGKLVAVSALKYFCKKGQRLKRKICLAADIIFSWEIPWNKFFMKSDLIRKIGHFDENFCYEDRDFIIRVLMNGSFKFMESTTTAYRIRLKNRLTPGLRFEDVMSDFRTADCKNYLNASGVIRLLLGIEVYSCAARYNELGVKNVIFIWLGRRMFGLLKKMVVLANKCW